MKEADPQSGRVGRKWDYDKPGSDTQCCVSWGLWTGWRGSANSLQMSRPLIFSHFSLPQTVPGALRLFVNGEVGKCLARQRSLGAWEVLGESCEGATHLVEALGCQQY